MILSHTPPCSCKSKEKEKEKKRNINNDLAVLPSHDKFSIGFDYLLILLYKWLCPTITRSHILPECSMITWSYHMIWLLNPLCYLYLCFCCTIWCWRSNVQMCGKLFPFWGSHNNIKRTYNYKWLVKWQVESISIKGLVQCSLIWLESINGKRVYLMFYQDSVWSISLLPIHNSKPLIMYCCIIIFFVYEYQHLFN